MRNYEDTFYRVRHKGVITIARYYVDVDSWEIIGDDCGYDTEDFDEIGEKIEFKTEIVEAKEDIDAIADRLADKIIAYLENKLKVLLDKLHL